MDVGFETQAHRTPTKADREMGEIAPQVIGGKTWQHGLRPNKKQSEFKKETLRINEHTAKDNYRYEK